METARDSTQESPATVAQSKKPRFLVFIQTYNRFAKTTLAMPATISFNDAKSGHGKSFNASD
jgi:hypothetical protein